MGLQLDLTGLNSWERVFYQTLNGDPANQRRRPKLPAIEPFDLPTVYDSRIFLVGATNLQSTYYRAGWLYYEVDGINFDDGVIFPDVGPVPQRSADADRRLILLNSVDLIIFPRLSAQLRLRFEPMPWLTRVSLALWEYQGPESDSTEELIDALRAQVATLEYKIDQLG
jgi:hypothetical protein